MAIEAVQHNRPRVGAVNHKPSKQANQGGKRGSSSQRGYGRRWEKFRLVFLAAHPLCEFCLPAGRVTPATVVDHDLPHEGDTEAFWATTFTALCKRHHDSTKQRLEAKYSGDDLLRQVARIKAGVDSGTLGAQASRSATLLWGPPAAGKTTEAQRIAASTGAIVYDLDDVAESIGLPRYGRTMEQARRASAVLKARLAQHPDGVPLVLIVSAPLAKTRTRWARDISATSVRLVVADRATCINRVMADTQRQAHMKQQVEIIDKWFACVE